VALPQERKGEKTKESSNPTISIILIEYIGRTKDTLDWKGRGQRRKLQMLSTLIKWEKIKNVEEKAKNKKRS